MLLPVALTPRKQLTEPEAVDIDYPKHLLEEWRIGDKDGLLFSPVTYTGERVKQEAVTTITALVLDYDDGTDPLAAIEPWLPYDFVIYTTHSHTPEAPRFRLVFPLATPAEPEPFRALWRWAAERAAGEIDRTCKDLFRRYYWPARPTEDAEHFAIRNEGRLLAVTDAPQAPERPEARPSRLGTKASLLSALATLPRTPDATPAPGGLFAGIGTVRPGGFRQAEDVGEIESRCSFMAHARDDAATLGEPEWYAALSVWARCEGGDEIAHARSEPYPGYDESDTAVKLERAKAHGPATCARVSDLYAGCKTCPHFGRITSPVQLGAPDPVEAPIEAAERAVSDRDDAREALAHARAVVDSARASYREHQRQARDIVDADARTAETAPARLALEAAIEERDRAQARVKSTERQARTLEAAANPPEGAEPDVWGALKLTPATGTPVPCYSNVSKIVRLDPLLGPNLRTNILGDVPEWSGRPVEDYDLSLACEYLADSYGLEARLNDVKSAIGAVASQARYNPVAEYLRALPAWDGTPRFATLLRDVLRVEDTPDGLYATYLRTFLLAAVRRAFAPGVKADTMLVLQGAQGLKKSEFFKALFQERFVHDTSFDIGNKDAFGQIAYGWLYEWAELSGLSRKEIEAVKNFLTSAKDTYRSPYAHYARVHYRHTVFGGTTNNPTPLNDPTGARRFLIIPMTERADLVLLGALRDSLWAEAVARADAGELHYLNDNEDELRAADSAQFEEEDPRRTLIARWLHRRADPFDIADLCVVLGIPPDRIAARMIGGHLRALGAVSRTMDSGASRHWLPPRALSNVYPIGSTENRKVFTPGT